MKRTLILLVLIMLIPAAAAGAEDPERASRIGLGISGITDPAPPADRDAAWSGSYVWFGEYAGKPIRFRVLAKDSTAYTEGKALFLDSDAALFDSVLDEDKPWSNSWNGSTLQGKLNGEFLAGFDVPERAAVALSTGNGGISWPEDLPSWWGVPVSVNDRVFLLDHAEVRNEAYGYSSDSGMYFSEEKNRTYSHSVFNRKKAGSPRSGCWLLRTASAENSENRGWHVLGILPDGSFFTKNAADAGIYAGSGGIGIAPALNVDQKSILFSVRIGADEFKLTIIDDGLTVTVPEGKTVTVDGRTVTVPYGIGGPDASDETRAAVLILDKEYTPGNENGAAILCYCALDTDGTFTLPEGLDPAGWGTDYHVCLLAENLNTAYETDYAASPVPLNRPGALPAAGEVRVPRKEAPAPDEKKDGSNTCLGAAGIDDPVPGGDGGELWSGHYVYFGRYDGKPIRFRVLAARSTAYTEGEALFLDSDEALFVDSFDAAEPVSGAWASSELRSFLNGPFLDGFSAQERAAVALSAGDGGHSFDPDAPQAAVYGAPVPVNDRVFLLDAADVTNAAYGYAPGPGWKYIFLPVNGVKNHVKAGAFTYWWLRSAVSGKPGCAADVNPEGTLNELEADSPLGVAPALNVDLGAVLFATQVGPKEFKLTLIDEDLAVSVPEDKAVSLKESTVTIPCEIGGPDASDTTLAAVLILDKEYTPGNENGAAILCYDVPDAEGDLTLPEGLDPSGWGTDFFVYVLAESRHGAHETDYACAPVKVEAP